MKLQGSFRLRDLLGATPADLTEGHFQTLISQKIREDDDLDFKRENYGGTDSEKREFAADLASMGNHRGGVIIIGIRDEADTAVELTPVKFAIGAEGRLRQIAASNIVPHLPIEIHVVPASSDQNSVFLVLVVPSSPQKPHAVRNGNDLRFPIRDGSTKRWLSEAEIASMYRDRFTSVHDQISRLDLVSNDGISSVDLTSEYAYLALSLVPTSPGSMSLGFAQLRELESWATTEAPTYWRGFFGSRPTARTGMRRVRLGNLHGDGLPKGPYAELHTDGSGFCCNLAGRPDRGDDSGPSSVPSLWLLWELSQGLSLLGHHAVANTGAWGDAIVEARLVGGEMNLTYPYHYGFSQSWNESPLLGPLIARNTLPLDSLVGSDQELLVSTRLIASDFYNAFGAAEVAGIDQTGRIRLAYFDDQKRLAAMAEAAGIEVTTDGA